MRMDHEIKCNSVCHSHEDMTKWRDKVDNCIYNSDSGMLVNLTKVLEGFATVQKVVYGAICVAILALGTSILKLVVR